MNPLTGVLDNSDRLRAMRHWLNGTPNGVYPTVLGEVQLRQTIEDRARLDRLAAMVAASYPGVGVGGQSSQVVPHLPPRRVVGKLAPGPLLRGAGLDAVAHAVVLLSISSSPVAINFIVDPLISEAAFRALVQARFATIAAAAA